MKTAHIVGKGTTAKSIKRADFPNDILVGINHGAMFIDELDYIFANDVEGLEGMADEKFNHVKNIAIPEHPHVQGIPRADITYKRVVDKFPGKPINFIIYNLFTWKPQNPDLPTPERANTSAGMAVGYLLKYENVKQFELYGIGKGNGYHQTVLDILPKEQVKFKNNWDGQRKDDLIESIIKACAKYNAKVNFN
jgi:hypothetical protein